MSLTKSQKLLALIMFKRGETKREIQHRLSVSYNVIDWFFRKRGLTKYKITNWTVELCSELKACDGYGDLQKFSTRYSIPYTAVTKKYQDLGGKCIARPYKNCYGYLAKSCGRDNTIMEHRRVMSESLGRELRSDEIVHHKNGDKADNRLSNLEVVSRAEHINIHRPELMAGQRRKLRRSNNDIV